MATPGKTPPARYDDLAALYINCTLNPSPQTSHTEKLMRVSEAIMTAQGVRTTLVRAVDYVLPPGLSADMTEYGYARDDWPDLYEQVKAADILVLGTPIWLGEKSSICSRVIERLYGMSGEQNAKGQFIFYGRTGGCIVTGNEDGIKHVGMGVFYSLQHIGYVVPPQADAGWIGEAGPGPSYGDALDDGSRAGFDNNFTKRNVTFMSWNLMHMARLLKDAGGIPAYGNQSREWQEGERFGYPGPEV